MTGRTRGVAGRREWGLELRVELRVGRAARGGEGVGEGVGVGVGMARQLNGVWHRSTPLNEGSNSAVIYMLAMLAMMARRR